MCDEGVLEEDIVRRMLDLDVPGTRRRGLPKIIWEDACKRDVTRGGAERG